MVSSDCMGWVRAHRARLAGAWLAFQTCVLLSIPAALWITPPPTLTPTACACPHDRGETCPMHQDDSRPCSCRSSADPATGFLSSLVGSAAVLARPVHLLYLTRLHLPACSDPGPDGCARRPGVPPPRA